MGKEVDFDDDDLEKNMESDDIERYSAKEGRKDLIRILTKPIMYFIHTMDRKPYYCNCGKDDGKQGQCLLCDRDISLTVKIGVVICHIASKGRRDKKYQSVGGCKVWLFGKDKYKSLRSMIEDYADGDPAWLLKQDLFIDCKEEKFQDLDIRHTGKESKVNKETAGDLCYNFKKAKEQLKWFTKASELKYQKKALGMDADDTDDVDDITDVDPDPVDDIDDSMASNPEEPISGDGVDDILDKMDDPFSPDDDGVPW